MGVPTMGSRAPARPRPGIRARAGPRWPAAAAVLALLLLVSVTAWTGRQIRREVSEIVEVERELAALRERVRLPGGPGAGDSARPAGAREEEGFRALLDGLVAERRRRVLAYERLEIVLVAWTGALPLLALAVVWRFGTRQRALLETAEAVARESHEQRREVERVVAQEEAFLRGVAHDLRPPLSTIDAYAELLAPRMDPSGEERMYLERIRLASQEVQGVVNDLLHLARPDAARNVPGPADGS